jgi:hypothetical protein
VRYQLVLQFPAASLGDYDAMVALEDELSEHLGDTATVDGHDFGSGQANIFILTGEPSAAFSRVKPLLERTQRLEHVTAAYRDLSGEHYTVVWPKNSTHPFRLV